MSPTSSIKFEYPDLPVVLHRQEFLELLKIRKVVIVQADTGSGKSTQLPKFLLEAGVALGGKLGVTQPRRLAALSIADRLREELGDKGLVSSKIRFFEEGPADAPIKVMTDGILLQEFRRDRLFSEYAAVMLDEAHERSLNIDILLGIMKRVLKERPEFRLVIASATMDAALFQNFFEDSAVLVAEGRTFPVEVVYRPPTSGKALGDCEVLTEALEAILDLEAVERDNLLCFLPTERDIQDLSQMLRGSLDERFEVLELFGRMNPADQRKVFSKTAKTRVVLATNIAETSLTIPGIAYVVDAGSARVSRYNAQTRIQGIPIEKISQASARQRTGRAGRVKPGICVRLYSEQEFLDREEYTEPEIRRSNLANVVLQLRSLGLGVEKFEFLQAPPRSSFRGAYKALFELGAITSPDAFGAVTALGREMAKLPMDVALSAVLLRAREAGVLKPAIIVAAALSLQDPRILPLDEGERKKVREQHRRYGGHKSDFLTFISIWNAFSAEWTGTSWNSLRKFCEKHYLHFLRCREWLDLCAQYARLLKVDFGERTCPLDSFHSDNLHMALLAGFLGGVAKRDADKACYKLVGGREAHIFPGSDLAGKAPEWLFSAEVRETSRVFLTKNAELRPEWLLKVAAPFCTRRWYEPAWNRERGFVEAVEEVSFRGMVVSRGRRVDYARIDPDDCARIFFREAVVNMDLARPFPFMEHNAKVLEALSAAEARLRRFGLAPSEEQQVEFFVRAAPGVCSVKTLKAFIQENSDKALRLSEADFLRASEIAVPHFEKFSHHAKFSLGKPAARTEAKFGGSVEFVRLHGRLLKCELVFDSQKPNDGLSLFVPAAMLSELSPSKLALELPRWRRWLLDSFFQSASREVSKRAAELRERLDDAFCDELEKAPENSPLKAFSAALASVPRLANEPCPLSSERERHLNLHLYVVKKNGEELRAELSPECGAFSFLELFRALVPEEVADLPFGKFRLGMRSGRPAVMEAPEAEFYRTLAKTKVLHPEFLQDASNRLSLLETLGACGKAPAPPTEKEKVLAALLASDWEPKNTERFSGLEAFSGRRAKSLSEILPKEPSHNEVLRTGLSKICYEAALLGGGAFTECWQLLKQTLASLREGRSIPERVAQLASSALEARSAYEILKLVTRFLGLEELPDSEPFPLETLSVKKLREELRPLLQARSLKPEDLGELRAQLSALERTPTSSPEFEALYVKVKLLQEKLEALLIRRGRLEEPEELEEADLKKLKERFGKIR